MLGNALCLVPAILNGLSRQPDRWLFCLAIIDISAILSQTSIFWAWPVIIIYQNFILN